MSPECPSSYPVLERRGGELEASVKNGMDCSDDGMCKSPNILINSSRGIIYADRSADGFADGARHAAARLRDDINRVLAQEGAPW